MKGLSRKCLLNHLHKTFRLFKESYNKILKSTLDFDREIAFKTSIKRNWHI